MNKLTKIIIIIAIVVLLFCVVGVNAKTNYNNKVNWNVSDSLKETSDKNGALCYSDSKDDDYGFRVIDSEINKTEFKDMTKDNETGYYYRTFNEEKFVIVVYQEYVELDNHTYLIDAMATKIGDNLNESNIDENKLKEYITYFNKHNNATIVDV